MSQVKAIEIVDISVDQIRPSPYQPRLYFDIESLLASIDKDGLISTPTVRRKPDGRTEYELVDGERRLRSVEKLGWETIPVQVVDIDDETARRIVFTLNEERAPYNAEEYTKFFRKMYDQIGTYLGVANAFGKHHSTIIDYVNISILPEHLKKAVWARKISIGIIQEMEPVFTEAKNEAGGVSVDRNYSNSQAYQYICSVLEELILAESKKPRETVREQYIDPYLERLEGERVRKAKEEAEKIIPKDVEVKVDLESPKGLRQAAKALLKKAEKLKSPEEVLEELREKARDSLSKGRVNAKSKIENAAELGLDTSEFEKRYREIESQIEKDPEAAYNESKEFKKEIDKAIKKDKDEKAKKKREDRELRIREEAAANARAEAQAEADKEIQKVKETVKEEVKKELQEDSDFRARIAKEEREKRLDEFKRRYELEEPVRDMGQKYHERVVSTFYRIRGWGVPMVLSMGEKWWNETIPYIQGINDWISFILMIKPDKKVEEQPKEPLLRVEIDEHKIIEAEYEVVKEG